MMGCLCSILATVLSAAVVAILFGVGLGRWRDRGRPTIARPTAAREQWRRQLAAAESENARLRARVETLEAQMRTVVGRGCIITVDWRKPQR
jgi:cell division protein FtsB